MTSGIKIDSKLIDSIVQGIKDEDEANRSFFESEEFNGLVKIIGEHERIDDEDLGYNIQKIKGLNVDNFCRVCNSVFYVLAGSAQNTYPGGFEKHTIDYRNIRFNLLIGQGAAYWTERLSKS